VSMLHWLQRAMTPAAAVAAVAYGRAVFRGAPYACTTYSAAKSYEDVVKAESALAESISTSAPPGSRWLGEKFLGFDLLRLFRAFDAGDQVLPVFLLRDPRDVFLSVKRFNAQRGARSFNDTGDDARLLKVICQFEERQIAEHGRVGGVLCRYEDLVAPASRDAALRALLLSLRIAAPPAAVAAIWAQVDAGREQVASHITGGQLPGDLAAPEFADIFAVQASLLAQLGYPAASKA
jgi:hypothetical protein